MTFTVLLRKVRGKNLTRLNSQVFINELADEAVIHALETKKLLEKPIETWVSKPQITYTVLRTADGIEAQIGTDDNIYRFLNDGTSIRFAVMSDDWESKTTVNSLDAGPGAGYVVARGGDVDYPRPGIEARNWTIIARNAVIKEFRRGMRNAVARGKSKMAEYGE